MRSKLKTNRDFNGVNDKLYFLVKEYIELIGVDRITQNLIEVQQVIEYLKNRKFNKYADVGLSFSGSLWLYANLLCSETANVWGIDIRVMNSTATIIKDTLKKKGQSVKLIQGDSKYIGKQLKEKFDLVHIDAQHGYGDVSEDFFIYYNKLIKNGVIILHDTLLQQGCIQFRKELEKTHNIITFSSGEERTMGVSVVIKEEK